jgi:endonuclease/exonuclease/phosphatase family metal-dependent hydrolase
LRPASTIVTGDFNLEPDDPLHARLGDAFDDGTTQLVDAWTTAHPGEPHPGTFKLYEKDYPEQPELHCDFIFVSEDLSPRVCRRSRRPRNAGGGPSAGHSDARLNCLSAGEAPPALDRRR